MSRYTSAYSDFLGRLGEVRRLLVLARPIARSPSPADLQTVAALCRSGVVLLSGHIEGYCEDLGELILERIHHHQIPKGNLGSVFRFHLSRDLIEGVRQAQQPVKIEGRVKELFERDSAIWDASPSFRNSLNAEVFLADFSNPTHKRICAFFRRFGFATFETALGSRLGSSFRACANMVDQVVEQRNKIAHGDIVTTATPSDLKAMIDLVHRYSVNLDRCVATWFGRIHCPLR